MYINPQMSATNSHKAKARVLKKHPFAVEYYNVLEGGYEIEDMPTLSYKASGRFIGSGETKDDAWIDAARRLK